ncbi:MAG: hypothetical protein SNJ50_21305, partial [Cyanobacteriota bacterium]
LRPLLTSLARPKTMKSFFYKALAIWDYQSRSPWGFRLTALALFKRIEMRHRNSAKTLALSLDNQDPRARILTDFRQISTKSRF